MQLFMTVVGTQKKCGANRPNENEIMSHALKYMLYDSCPLARNKRHLDSAKLSLNSGKLRFYEPV